MLAGGLYERTSGAAGQPLGGYRRRTPERTVLHELVAGHAQTMLAELRDADPEGGGLPRYVERELAAYLRCGILAHGFARVRCQACGDEIVVAFSCKRRGICPSCTARRMADTAAHLVDRVLPRAPYRQWVFTVPKPLRLDRRRGRNWPNGLGWPVSDVPEISAAISRKVRDQRVAVSTWGAEAACAAAIVCETDCDDACRVPARATQKRIARARHQQSSEGRADHAERNRELRLRGSRSCRWHRW